MTIEDLATPAGFMSDSSSETEKVIIKVVGVGGGGNNAVSHMFKQDIKHVSFVVCNTDRQALLASPVPNKLLIGNTGLGAGNNPAVAREAAEQSIEKIGELFEDDTRMVFITAGMGGGTGTGAAPVVARIAREKGMLTIGIVTIPFLFEGRKKILKALEGADEMRKYVDALLVINNERLTEIYPDLQFMNAFGKADDTLTTAARGISELITNEDHVINIDFNDVDTTLRGGGAAIISIGFGEGENRVTKAINDALNSPLLKDSVVTDSKRILFNIYFNPDAEQEFVMSEANELSNFIASIDHEVDVIWGLAPDRSLGNKVKITLLAAGFSTGLKAPATEVQQRPAIGKEPDKKAEEFVVVPPKGEDILKGLYGEDKSGIIGTTEAKKHIIFTPEQLSDDNVIEVFENTPTYKRQVRVAEEIRNSAKKAEQIPTPAPEKPASEQESGTTISFL